MPQRPERSAPGLGQAVAQPESAPIPSVADDGLVAQPRGEARFVLQLRLAAELRPEQWEPRLEQPEHRSSLAGPGAVRRVAAVYLRQVLPAALKA